MDECAGDITVRMTREIKKEMDFKKARNLGGRREKERKGEERERERERESKPIFGESFIVRDS